MKAKATVVKVNGLTFSVEVSESNSGYAEICVGEFPNQVRIGFVDQNDPVLREESPEEDALVLVRGRISEILLGSAEEDHEYLLPIKPALPEVALYWLSARDELMTELYTIADEIETGAIYK